ncbi:FtsB family cell division protein [Paracoccaceae bacterium GXU_MW_L88]
MSKRPTFAGWSFGKIAPVAFFALAGYFAFTAISGDHGIFRRIEIESAQDAFQGELDTLTDRRMALENKTRRLSDDYLDLELLDERARATLGLTAADEIVIR